MELSEIDVFFFFKLLIDTTVSAQSYESRAHAVG